VCGDDLIASWPEDVADRYERNLEALGLKVNKSKSFRGRRGVFCENAVVISDDKKHITVLPTGKLSALTASRFLDDRSRSALGVVEGLCQESRSGLAVIAEETRANLMRQRRKIPGPVRLGGCGRGAPTRGRLGHLSSQRPAAFNRRTRDERRITMRKELADVSVALTPTCPEGDVVLTLEEGNLHVSSALDFVLACKGQRTKIKNLSVKQHGRSYKEVQLEHEDFARNAKEKLCLNARQVRLVRRLAKKSGKKSRQWLGRVLTRPPSVKYVLRSQVLSIIRQTLRVQWDSQIQRPAGNVPDAPFE
jgi:hypothetical protein